MASSVPLGGIHHVTAICGDPQRNVDFYAGLLGLRLVKRTVNFDDPGAYHLYYGDELGRPGTAMTFFAWPGAPRGRRGVGQIVSTAFAIPTGSMGYWLERFQVAGVAFERPTERFGADVVAFYDPDGLLLELVTDGVAADRPAWEAAPVPTEHALRGFHSVTLSAARPQSTGALLAGPMALAGPVHEPARQRYEVGRGSDRGYVEVSSATDAAPGRIAVGTVHHVAWRVPDDASQADWRERLSAAGISVTPVLDRQYFRSIYFTEPGGVIFEIATDGPGFATDESPGALGTAIKLPPWLEPSRSRIEEVLVPLRPPS